MFAVSSKFAGLLNLLKLIKRAFGEYRWHIVLVTVLAFLNGVLEGVGVSAAIPLFSLINNQAAKSTDLVSQSIEWFLGFLGVALTLRSLLLFVGILFVVKTIVLFCVQYINARIVYAYENSARVSLFSSTIEADWEYLSKQKVGHLDQLLITNTTNSSQFFIFFGIFALVLSKLVTYTFVLVNISAPIAVLSLGLGAAAFFLFRPLFYRNRVISAQAEELNRTLAHFVNQHVIGMKTVKSMFADSVVIGRGKEFFGKMKNLSINIIVVRGLTEMYMKLLSFAFVGALFVFYYRTADFNLAAFAVAVYAINQIFTQIQTVQSQLHAVKSLEPYIASMLSYKENAVSHAEKNSGGKEFSFSREIRFEDVSFSYEGREEKALHGVSFAVRKGEMVGLIGPSGAGKTTVVDLMLRLYEPRSGLILIDGTPVSEISLGGWRTNVGYVAQDIFLLNDTVRRNIEFYSDALSDDDVEQAAKLAHIHDFILTLPKGYDTVVGERGLMLSGGQRQRIILARVLARKPDILILDEATSALDRESEIAVQGAINGLHGQVTVLIIAHRLSTLSAVDTMIALEGGKIVEQGKPSELLKDPESYLSRVHFLANQ